MNKSKSKLVNLRGDEQGFDFLGRPQASLNRQP